MKLKTFTPDNCKVVKKSGVAAVGMNLKTGLFNMNKVAADLIGLKSGDSVLISQDEENPEDWYIEKVENGFVVRNKVNVGTGVLFNNATIVRAIAESVGCKKSGRILVAGVPTEFEGRTLFGLLTSSLPKI